jgi:saccharopine dehydrogenase-like NADP-dependent oxidoreductase
MKKILVVGAGKIGTKIGELLAHSGDYQVTLADSHLPQAENNHHPAMAWLQLDVRNAEQLRAAVGDHFAVLSACPFDLTPLIAKAAAQQGTHYLDLTEDVASTREVKKLAADANCAFIPQSGLAPGFISIAAYDIAKRFDRLHDVHLRVGALPIYPSNALKYNLTWSTEGLINEYCNPCEAIVNGQLTQVPPLEEMETFSLDGITYEAFNTSGGLGTLCHTLEGKVKNLNYRTVRYPGHRDIMKMLLQDLRLNERQPLLKEILETALPATHQDVVLVFINVSGIKKGRFVQESYANKIYNQTIGGQHFSAIQVTTAASACAVIDLLATGKTPQRGFVRQEDISFDDFIHNRFGRYYSQDHSDHKNTEHKNVA